MCTQHLLFLKLFWSTCNNLELILTKAPHVTLYKLKIIPLQISSGACVCSVFLDCQPSLFCKMPVTFRLGVFYRFSLEIHQHSTMWKSILGLARYCFISPFIPAKSLQKAFVGTLPHNIFRRSYVIWLSVGSKQEQRQQGSALGWN